MVNHIHMDAIFETASEVLNDGTLMLRIRGKCMEPTLRDGDQASVRRSRFPLPGDIVVFRNATSLVAHRMIGWAPFEGRIGIITRGDHCDRHDGVVPPDRILGRVDITIPFAIRLLAVKQLFSIVVGKLARHR